MKNTEQTQQTILVFAAAPGRYHEFERFLSRRGWNVRFHTDMKSFLTDVIALQPQFALVSVDAKVAEADRSRHLAATVYRVRIIDFAEEQTLESWQRLREATGEYQIYGILTGPAFERAMVHITSRANDDDTNIVAADAFLQEGVSRIFRDHLEQRDGAVETPLNWTSEVLCVQVKTPLVSGHFLIAAGHGKILKNDLMEIMRASLVALVQEIGGDPETLQTFPLEIRRVEFKKWAEAEARFLEAAPHRGVEIALAFFPAGIDVFTFEPGADEEHLAVRLDEIRADRLINYNLFVHLPLNGRYVLYVSRGGMLNLHQQLNLQAKGLRHLHIEKGDRSLMLRDRASRSLDAKIAEFYEARVA